MSNKKTTPEAETDEAARSKSLIKQVRRKLTLRNPVQSAMMARHLLITCVTEIEEAETPRDKRQWIETTLKVLDKESEFSERERRNAVRDVPASVDGEDEPRGEVWKRAEEAIRDQEHNGREPEPRPFRQAR